MAKTIHKDGTYTICGLNGMNPKLTAKQIKDGRDSLYLEYYFGVTHTPDAGGELRTKAVRRREALKMYIWTKPRTEAERIHNRDTLQVAQRIRYEREQQLNEARTGARVQSRERLEFFEFARAYTDSRPNPTTTKHAIIKRFARFLADTPKYRVFANSIEVRMITPDICRDYAEWLKPRCVGGGANRAIAYFSQILGELVERGYIPKNPCKGVKPPQSRTAIAKEILNPQEIQRLIKTPMPPAKGNKYAADPNGVRRAFIFSLYTGLRFCDVSRLTYENIDYENKRLKVTQKKVEGRSDRAEIIIPLSEYLLRLIGEPPKQYKARNVRLFPLYLDAYAPRTWANKMLARWTEAAGITKRITWHCARHSFAVNLLQQGTDIKTTAELMGHTSIAMTEKYLHVVDENKVKAINNLPTFEE